MIFIIRPPLLKAKGERKSVIIGEKAKRANIEFVKEPVLILFIIFSPSFRLLNSTSVFSSGSSSIIL